MRYTRDLIVITGSLNASYHFDGQLTPLISSSWGRTLSIKLAMVFTMVALAVANWFVLLPRLKIGTSAALPVLARSVFIV